MLERVTNMTKEIDFDQPCCLGTGHATATSWKEPRALDGVGVVPVVCFPRYRSHRESAHADKDKVQLDLIDLGAVFHAVSSLFYSVGV